MKTVKNEKHKLHNLLAPDEPLGTNPKPEAPITTPEDSFGPSVGGIGKTTGPRFCIFKFTERKLFND